MKRYKLLKLAMVATALLAFNIGQASAADKVKAAFVYLGPIGDHGWTYQHNEGVEMVKRELGNKVKVTYVENVPEGPDSARVIEKLARSNDIVFTTSFGYMNPTINVAKKFPKVKFEHATGFKRSKNVSTYSARFYEGRYVAGKVVGSVTKTNTIGYVASFPIPEVVRGINSAYLGAKSVNPNVKFKIIWVSSWFDPGKETEAAKALIAQGADVLMQHTDSPAVMTVAEDAGIHAIGQASNMAAFGPNAHLTAIVNNWGPYYVDRIKAVMKGTWEEQDTFYGINENMVTFAPYGKAVPKSVQKIADKTIADLRSNKIHPFTGPLNKQDGSEWLKSGEVAPIGTILGMNFYVEGVDGVIPQ